MKNIDRIAAMGFAALASVSAAGVETPTMGWSSWNAFRVNISEKTIEDHADLIIKLGLDKLGYVYVNTDDGYFGGRDKNGMLITHPKRFPNGLKAMVDHIHSLGLKAGIYSDGGENTCGSIYDRDELGKGVGFLGHEQQDADFFFKELGFDFIKIDFCGGTPRGNSMKRNLDERERYTAIRKAVDNAKPGVRINVCRWDYPGNWVRTIGSSWRISHDISPRWSSAKDIILQSLYLSAYAGPGAFNDMDMLEVGRGMSDEEDNTHFAVWCIMTSPLLIGCDIRKLQNNAHAFKLITNRELIAVDQDPLCQQAYVAKREGETYVLVKDLQTANGKVRAVAFLNLTEEQVRMSVNLEDIELGGNVVVRDILANRQCAPAVGSFSVEVPAHGTRIYRMMAENRLERKVYEAETAYLSAYQELHDSKKAGTAYYNENAICSGGVSAANLGGSKENDLIWSKVNSKDGGDCTLELQIVGNDAANVNMELNGAAVKPDSVANGEDGLSRIGYKVRLQKGDNKVRLYNETDRMPEIDCLRLVK